MKVGLIDVDSKLPNLPLMKLSRFHKAQGDTVILNPQSGAGIDISYASVVFAKNRCKAEALTAAFPNMTFGGTGWDLKTCLPAHIESLRPDYDLYTAEDLLPRIKGIMKKETRMKKVRRVLDAGIGFIYRGCFRKCPFCVIKEKEGDMRRVGEIRDIVNERSDVLILLDANITSAPTDDFKEIMKEIRERNMRVSISQGLDIRLMTPEKAEALSKVRHVSSLAYAWDFVRDQETVLRGIDILSRFVKTWRHLCYCLVGYDTTFEDDQFRVNTLIKKGVDPYVMTFEDRNDRRLKAYERYINSRIYKTGATFEEYRAWIRVKDSYFASEPTLFAAA